MTTQVEQIPDHILDKALAMHLDGKSLFEIGQEFPQYQEVLSEWLDVVNLLETIPHAEPPAPIKSFRYAEKTSAWAKIVATLSYYKLATVPLVLAVVFASGFSVISATAHSLPGDKLYTLKIAGERAKLNLTFDQEKIAQLHVQLAQKRLEETKKVIEGSDPDQESAALDQLTKQTEATISAVSSLAASRAVTQKDSALLENLVAINKEQKSVIQTITDSQTEAPISEDALSAANASDKSVAQLIATVNDQSLLDLPNKISITGLVTTPQTNRIVVERNTFNLNTETIITDADGELITDATSIKGKITVIGTREDNNLIAKRVVILDPNAQTTVIPNTTPATTTPSTSTQEPEPEPENTQVQKPSEVTSGFIVEPADNQYSQ